MPAQPNILLITTDQQRFDTIAAAGNGSIYTPHLNWLCDEGVRYGRAYSDCPICIPGRVTIMTGQHGWTHGTVVNSGARLPLRDWPTLPGVLTERGYQTRGQGKMHFTPARTHYGFERIRAS
jgi:arylsulfatase A-like enzyme